MGKEVGLVLLGIISLGALVSLGLSFTDLSPSVISSIIGFSFVVAFTVMGFIAECLDTTSKNLFKIFFITAQKKLKQPFANCIELSLTIFHNLRHFSNQVKDRSTTHLFGNTTKECNSLRFITSTVAPIISFI